MKTAAVSFCLSMFSRMKSERYVTAVWVECRFLKPNWCSERTLFSVNNETSRTWIARSIILDIRECTEIGRLLLTSSFSPDLKIGVTLASFHSCGISSVEKVKLIRSTIGLATYWAASFNSLAGIPWSPVAFVDFSLRSSSNTKAGLKFSGMNSRSTLGVSTLGGEGSVKCPHKLPAMVVKYWLNLVADKFSISTAVFGFFGNILFCVFHISFEF